MTGLSLGTIAAVGLILTACSPGPSPLIIEGREVRTIELTMTDDMRFDPESAEVSQGETVRFFIRNVSSLVHEAYIGTAVEQELREQALAGLSADQRQETTHYGYGIRIVPLGNGEFVYHFAEAGEFIIGCHEPGHYPAGHRFTIQVRASS
jgi:uncharacterized cupredoxin-like copper-binding protein